MTSILGNRSTSRTRLPSSMRSRPKRRATTNTCRSLLRRSGMPTSATTSSDTDGSSTTPSQHSRRRPASSRTISSLPTERRPPHRLTRCSTYPQVPTSSTVEKPWQQSSWRSTTSPTRHTRATSVDSNMLTSILSVDGGACSTWDATSS